MIVIKLRDGLGNQLFQYAIGRSLALKYNTQLVLDLSRYMDFARYAPREFMLEHFNLGPKVLAQGDTNQKNYGLVKYLIEKPKNYYSFQKNIFDEGDDILLDGFWQSYKYFDNYSRVIQKEFTLKEKINPYLEKITKQINDSNSVAIHVRRTDYVNLPQFCTISPDYYSNAIKEISSKVKDPTFFLFSDDIEGAKKSIDSNTKIIPVDSKNPLDDFALMKMCKHQIIANSTFSWWAAWLNANPQKIIISPKNWVKGYSTKDLIPKEWIQIK